MSAELVVAGYVRIAKQDLDGARLLNAGVNRNAAYLCEQAAEKLIRAVLTSELPDMVASIPDANPAKLMLQAIQDLDVYATAFRYPSPKGRVKTPPTPAEDQEYIARIELALTELAMRFAIDLTKPDGPAGNARPIR